MTNLLPRPSSLSTDTANPCMSPYSRTSAKPKPLPLYLRVDVLSTCTNRSKMRAWSSGAMPMPSSTIDNVTTRASASYATRSSMEPPSGVNLMALLARFSSMRVVFS